MPKVKVCTWEQDANGIYETSCGEAYEVSYGTPNDNEMRYCCYCGGKLVQKLYHDDSEEDK